MAPEVSTEKAKPEEWAFWEALMTSSLRGEAWRRAGEWALKVLKNSLGPGWLPRTMQDYDLPPALVYAAGHTVAFAETLELALRLKLLERNPGMRHLRTTLKRDPRPGQIAHLRIQLEVAALAVRHGSAVRVEDRQEFRGAPTDVLIRMGEELIAVETVAILAGDEWRATSEYTHEMFHHIHMIEGQYQVTCSGEVGRVLPPQAIRVALEELERVAKKVARDGQERLMQSQGIRLTISRESTSEGKSLRGPIAASDLWPKIDQTLRNKATQSLGKRNVWIRLDALQGLWQFTPWGSMTLEDKVPLIGGYFKEILSQQSHIAGVVLSSGALLAQGEFTDEMVESEFGIAIRRVLPALRVRETIILRTNPAADPETIWRTLYDEEPIWLGWGLNLAGLPSVEEIF